MQRNETIRANLSLGKALSPAASTVNDRIQDALADLADLDAEEQRRLLLLLTAQLAARAAQL